MKSRNPYEPPRAQLDPDGAEDREGQTRPLPVVIIFACNVLFNITAMISAFVLKTNFYLLSPDEQVMMAQVSPLDFLSPGIWVLGIALLFMLLIEAIPAMGLALLIDILLLAVGRTEP